MIRANKNLRLTSDHQTSWNDHSWTVNIYDTQLGSFGLSLDPENVPFSPIEFTVLSLDIEGWIPGPYQAQVGGFEYTTTAGANRTVYLYFRYYDSQGDRIKTDQFSFVPVMGGTFTFDFGTLDLNVPQGAVRLDVDFVDSIGPAFDFQGGSWLDPWAISPVASGFVQVGPSDQTLPGGTQFFSYQVAQGTSVTDFYPGQYLEVQIPELDLLFNNIPDGPGLGGQVILEVFLGPPAGPQLVWSRTLDIQADGSPTNWPGITERVFWGSGSPADQVALKFTYIGSPIQIRDSIDWTGDFRVQALGQGFFKIGGKGVRIKYDTQSQGPFHPIQASTASWIFNWEKGNLAHQTFIQDLVEAQDEQRFPVEVLQDGILFWAGFLLVDQLTQQDEPFPTQVDLKATDRLGTLKDLDYDLINQLRIQNQNQTQYNFRETVIQHLIRILGATGVDMAGPEGYLNTQATLAAYEHPKDGSQDPLVLTRLDHRAFVQGGKDGDRKALTYYKALEAILVAFGLKVLQSGGSWLVQNIWDIQGARRWRYDSTGTPQGFSDTTAVPYQMTAKHAQGNEKYFPPIRQAEVSYKFYQGKGLIKSDGNLTTGIQLDGIKGEGNYLIFQIKVRLDNVPNEPGTGLPILYFIHKLGIQIQGDDGTSYLSNRVINPGQGQQYPTVTSPAWKTSTVEYFHSVQKISPYTGDGGPTSAHYITIPYPQATQPGPIPFDGALYVYLTTPQASLGWAFDPISGEIVSQEGLTPPDLIIDDFYFDIFRLDTPKDQVTEIKSLSPRNTEATQVDRIQTIFGDTSGQYSFGTVQAYNGTDWVDSQGWAFLPEPDLANHRPLGVALANIRYYFRSSPLQKLVGDWTGVLKPGDPLQHLSRLYGFSGGTFSTRQEVFSGEVFQLVDPAILPLVGQFSGTPVEGGTTDTVFSLTSTPQDILTFSILGTGLEAFQLDFTAQLSPTSSQPVLVVAQILVNDQDLGIWTQTILEATTGQVWKFSNQLEIPLATGDQVKVQAYVDPPFPGGVLPFNDLVAQLGGTAPSTAVTLTGLVPEAEKTEPATTEETDQEARRSTDFTTLPAPRAGLGDLGLARSLVTALTRDFLGEVNRASLPVTPITTSWKDGEELILVDLATGTFQSILVDGSQAGSTVDLAVKPFTPLVDFVPGSYVRRKGEGTAGSTPGGGDPVQETDSCLTSDLVAQTLFQTGGDLIQVGSITLTGDADQIDWTATGSFQVTTGTATLDYPVRFYVYKTGQTTALGGVQLSPVFPGVTPTALTVGASFSGSFSSGDTFHLYTDRGTGGVPDNEVSLLTGFCFKLTRSTQPDPGGGGSTTFLGLTDTPDDYLGTGGLVAKVNGTEDGLVFEPDSWLALKLVEGDQLIPGNNSDLYLGTAGDPLGLFRIYSGNLILDLDDGAGVSLENTGLSAWKFIFPTTTGQAGQVLKSFGLGATGWGTDDWIKSKLEAGESVTVLPQAGTSLVLGNDLTPLQNFQVATSLNTTFVTPFFRIQDPGGSWFFDLPASQPSTGDLLGSVSGSTLGWVDGSTLGLDIRPLDNVFTGENIFRQKSLGQQSFQIQDQDGQTAVAFFMSTDSPHWFRVRLGGATSASGIRWQQYDTTRMELSNQGRLSLLNPGQYLEKYTGNTYTGAFRLINNNTNQSSYIWMSDANRLEILNATNGSREVAINRTGTAGLSVNSKLWLQGNELRYLGRTGTTGGDPLSIGLLNADQPFIELFHSNLSGTAGVDIKLGTDISTSFNVKNNAGSQTFLGVGSSYIQAGQYVSIYPALHPFSELYSFEGEGAIKYDTDADTLALKDSQKWGHIQTTRAWKMDPNNFQVGTDAYWDYRFYAATRITDRTQPSGYYYLNNDLTLTAGNNNIDGRVYVTNGVTGNYGIMATDTGGTGRYEIATIWEYGLEITGTVANDTLGGLPVALYDGSWWHVVHLTPTGGFRLGNRKINFYSPWSGQSKNTTTPWGIRTVPSWGRWSNPGCRLSIMGLNIYIRQVY